MKQKKKNGRAKEERKERKKDENIYLLQRYFSS
jgi:hypothetical protein